MRLAGNLIIRAALTEPVLQAYLPLLWLFLSLSGPHLGYLCSANKLFCSGMWLFKKFTAGLPLLFFSDHVHLLRGNAAMYRYTKPHDLLLV